MSEYRIQERQEDRREGGGTKDDLEALLQEGRGGREGTFHPLPSFILHLACHNGGQ